MLDSTASNPYIFSFSFSDTTSLLSLIVASLALLASFYTIYLTKRIEIAFRKFEKLCLENVEKIFKDLDEIFERRPNDVVSIYRNKVTDVLTDLNIFLIQLKSVYPKIDLNQIPELSEIFSEQIYDNPNRMISDFKVEYLSTKIQILEKLYDYALYKEMSFIHRFLYNKNK